MEFSELVRKRHSVRDFKSDPVPRELIQQALESAALAPSAMNSQPWHFYVASGEARAKVGEIISQSTIHLAEYMDALGPRHYEDAVKWYSFLGEAPVVIGVTTSEIEGDFNLLNKYLSVGCALENLLLALTDVGLGACNITFSYWVRDELGAVFGIPAGVAVVACVAVGYPSDVPVVAPPRDMDVVEYLD
jgi:nitroreductase